MTTESGTRPILLVEDNPMDVDLTLRAFAKRKLVNRIDVARDGEEALAYVEKWKTGDDLPVVVLLDLKLPKVPGLDVLRHIKAHSDFRAIPVVVLTTSTEDSDVVTAYQLGANSYIVKPVDFDKFMDVAGHVELYWCVINKTPQ